MKYKYPVVMVHSRDQAYYGGHYNPDRFKFEVSELYTVGQLISEDKQKVIVATDVFDDEDVRYVSVILKENIVEMEVLREKT